MPQCQKFRVILQRSNSKKRKRILLPKREINGRRIYPSIDQDLIIDNNYRFTFDNPPNKGYEFKIIFLSREDRKLILSYVTATDQNQGFYRMYELRSRLEDIFNQI